MFSRRRLQIMFLNHPPVDRTTVPMTGSFKGCWFGGMGWEIDETEDVDNVVSRAEEVVGFRALVERTEGSLKSPDGLVCTRWLACGPLRLAQRREALECLRLELAYALARYPEQPSNLR
jgi:hypothetical protein